MKDSTRHRFSLPHA